MAEDWSGAAADVAVGIREAGQPVRLHQPATGGFHDPATETTTGGAPAAAHDTFAVEDQFSAFSIANGSVAAGDVKLLLSPLKADGTPTPRPEPDSWTVTMGGKVWTIKRVTPQQPAGLPLMFELQLRG